MKTYNLNEKGKSHIANSCLRLVKDEFISDEYIEQTIKEIENKDLIKITDESFELLKNSYEISKMDTKSGNPELIDLNASMFIVHEDL